MAEEVIWERLIYLGRRGDILAWRVHDRDGGRVYFVMAVEMIKDVLLGLRLAKPVVGADQDRHDWRLAGAVLTDEPEAIALCHPRCARRLAIGTAQRPQSGDTKTSLAPTKVLNGNTVLGC